MTNPEEIDFLVLQVIAEQYENGTVARETIRGAVELRAPQPCEAAELDDALARLRRDGHIVAREGQFAVSPSVAQVLPRTRTGAVSAAAASWQRFRTRLTAAARNDP